MDLQRALLRPERVPTARVSLLQPGNSALNEQSRSRRSPGVPLVRSPVPQLTLLTPGRKVSPTALLSFLRQVTVTDWEIAYYPITGDQPPEFFQPSLMSTTTVC